MCGTNMIYRLGIYSIYLCSKYTVRFTRKLRGRDITSTRRNIQIAPQKFRLRIQLWRINLTIWGKVFFCLVVKCAIRFPHIILTSNYRVARKLLHEHVSMPPKSILDNSLLFLAVLRFRTWNWIRILNWVNGSVQQQKRQLITMRKRQKI